MPQEVRSCVHLVHSCLPSVQCTAERLGTQKTLINIYGMKEGRNKGRKEGRGEGRREGGREGGRSELVLDQPSDKCKTEAPMSLAP